MVDKDLKTNIESKSSDKSEWLKTHTLSKEQMAQLMLNKLNRAKKDQENFTKLRKLVDFVD